MITIERVGNGFVVDYGEGKKFCYPTGGDGPGNFALDLLTDLVDDLGLAGSRHDERRLVIRESHGDKFTCEKEGCELCE